MKEITYYPLSIEKISHPIFIVGQSPGRVRNKDADTLSVWTGNRSGDIMDQIISGFKNLYLTNIYNIYPGTNTVARRYEAEGLDQLKAAIRKLEPNAIFCFGKYAYNHVLQIRKQNQDWMTPTIVSFQHPSYILRFHFKRIEKYIKNVRHAIYLCQ